MSSLINHSYDLSHFSPLHAQTFRIPSDSSVISSTDVGTSHHPMLSTRKYDSHLVCSTRPAVEFLRPHMPFKLATFNVRTLMRVGQQVGLVMSLENIAVDICCLQETRIQDSSYVTILVSPSNKKTVFHQRLSGDPEASASGQAGVGIVLSARAEAGLVDWIPVDSRLCAVRIGGSFKVGTHRNDKRCLFVVSAYAPTDCSPDVVKDRFYQRLNDLLRKAQKTDIVVLAGDLNARIGSLLTSEGHLGGRFGLNCGRSDNGDRLLSLCSDHQLFLTSTNFKNSKRRSATWRPPSSTQDWTQIDHIAISYRWRGSVQNCRSHWNTCLDSDHALVCATLSIRFGGTSKKATTRVDYTKLSEPAILVKFQEELANKLDSISPCTVDQRWKHIQDAMNSASLNSCGLTHRPVNHWVSSNSLRLLDTRQSVSADSAHNGARLALKRELTTSLRRDRETWWSERAAEMESAAAVGNSRKLFHLIRATGARRFGVSETICEVDGSPIHNLRRRLERWAEHFESQFNWPSVPAALSTVERSVPWSVSLDPPNEAEILVAINTLKRHKAPGPDNLPPALFKDGGDALVRELCYLFSHVWDKEEVLPGWRESTVIPIFKKGSRTVCGNHRGISLIPIASKILASILLRRLTSKREEQIREEQAGFRSGRGCIDQIFTLRQLLEHRHTYRRPTLVVFLDIRAAFDSVDRAVLWDCLLRNGVPEKYVTILKALYHQTSGRVRAYGKLSPPFVASSGVRQGCPISPFLFNFVIDDVLRKAFVGYENGGVELLPGDKVVDLEYADDIVLIAFCAQALQNFLNRLAIEVARYGMCFAPSKCKVLLQDWREPVPALTLAGERMNVVDSFVYLGSCITANGGAGEEVSMRIAKARSAFSGLRHLWRRHDIRLSLKGRVYAATVRAVLLYGCETWPLRVEDVRRLSAFDARCLRSIARVWWQQHVTNDHVRQRVLGSDSPPLETVISLHRLRWLGHVLRMPTQRLPFRALFARAGCGWKKERGGQTMTWRRCMKKLTEGLSRVGSSRLLGWGPKDSDCLWLETLQDMAQNRIQWRECSRFCCYGQQ